jgi:hypothetical protein
LTPTAPAPATHYTRARRQCLDEYYTGKKRTATIPPGANLGAKQYRDRWGDRINLGAKHRILVPPWIRPWLPADEVSAHDGGSSDEDSGDGGLGGGSDGGSSSQEYGEWSQSQSQSQPHAGPAKRPREAESGAGGKRQRQEE